MEFSLPVLTVSKFRECVRFYRDLLGCEVDEGDETSPVIYLRSGVQRLALLDRAARPADVPDQDEVGGSARVTLAFRSDDVDREYDRLKAADVRYTLEPRDFPEWNVRSSLCLDPDGNPVEIAGELKGDG